MILILLKEIKNPITKKVYELLKPKNGLEIHHMSDLQVKVGLAQAHLFVLDLNGISFIKNKIDKSYINQQFMLKEKMLGESIGDQDSIFASYGGFRKINFNKKETRINKLKISKDKIKEIEENILLFNTNIFRHASHVKKIRLKA